MSDFEISRPVQIDHIDRHGKKDTVIASEAECESLAKRFDLLSVKHLKADITIMPREGGTKYEVTGHLTAKVTQESVVSGKPVENDVLQDIHAWYADETRIASFEKAKKQRHQDEFEEDHEIKNEQDDPDIITNGVIDMGEITAQFLGLGLDDFPRGEDEGEGIGDHIEVKPEDARENPFAKLAVLKEKK